MRRRTFTSLCAIAVLCPMAAAARTEIDFDALPGGGSPTAYAEIGDAYASLGALFGTTDGDDRGEPQFRPVSDGTFRAGDFSRGDTAGFHILVTFDEPVTFVSADTFGPSDAGWTVNMRAYDSGGSLLAAVETQAQFGVFKGRLTLEEIGEIRSVIWSSNDSFVASVQIDDLAFEMVPEPSSLSLITMGFVVLGWSRHRSGRRSMPGRERQRSERAPTTDPGR